MWVTFINLLTFIITHVGLMCMQRNRRKVLWCWFLMKKHLLLCCLWWSHLVLHCLDYKRSRFHNPGGWRRFVLLQFSLKSLSLPWYRLCIQIMINPLNATGLVTSIMSDWLISWNVSFWSQLWGEIENVTSQMFTWDKFLFF